MNQKDLELIVETIDADLIHEHDKSRMYVPFWA